MPDRFGVLIRIRKLPGTRLACYFTKYALPGSNCVMLSVVPTDRSNYFIPNADRKCQPKHINSCADCKMFPPTVSSICTSKTMIINQKVAQKILYIYTVCPLLTKKFGIFIDKLLAKRPVGEPPMAFILEIKTYWQKDEPRINEQIIELANEPIVVSNVET